MLLSDPTTRFTEFIGPKNDEYTDVFLLELAHLCIPSQGQYYKIDYVTHGCGGYSCHPYKLSYGGVSKSFEPVGSCYAASRRDYLDIAPFPIMVIFQTWHQRKRSPPNLRGFAREAGCIIALAQKYFASADQSALGMMPNSDICEPYIVGLRPRNIVAYITAEVSRQYVHIINNGELRPGVAIVLLITPLYHLEILEERARFTKDYRNFLECVAGEVGPNAAATNEEERYHSLVKTVEK
jgi:hypothetical protein